MGLLDRAAQKTQRADSEQAQLRLTAQLGDRGLHTPLYVLGVNVDSLRWIHLLNVQAVIDDFLPLPACVEGKPVIRMIDVPEGALVINCVTNSRPNTAMRRLETNTKAQVFYGADIANTYRGSLPSYGFVEDSLQSVNARGAEWQALYDALSDATSKETLEDILAYRLCGDPRVLNSYSYRPKEQYFEDFLGLSDDIFVDGGAFDGETTELLLSKYPECRAVHLFEPDPENFGRSMNRLNGISRVVFHPVGLSDSPGELCFQVGDGSASVVAETGDMTISVDTIDRLAPDATFIKLDLEGWELKALMGAESTIIKNKPKLAIGAYHHPDDFLKIYSWVKTLRPDYQVSVRHYTESWTETVLYFY